MSASGRLCYSFSCSRASENQTSVHEGKRGFPLKQCRTTSLGSGSNSQLSDNTQSALARARWFAFYCTALTVLGRDATGYWCCALFLLVDHLLINTDRLAGQHFIFFHHDRTQQPHWANGHIYSFFFACACWHDLITQVCGKACFHVIG